MTDPTQLDRLRAELRRPGRSQTDLASALGIHPSAVNKMLAGKRQIKVRELATIESYLRQTNVSVEEVIKRAELESPHKASVTEVNAGLVSTSYPGPWSVRLDAAETTQAVNKLVAIAMGEDGDNLVVECWYYLSEHLKSAVCERLRGITPEDAKYLISGGPLEDFTLIKLLLSTFGILNDLEIERVALLHDAYIELRTHQLSETERLHELLDRFAPIAPDSEVISLKGRILTGTLDMASTILSVRHSYIQRIAQDAAAVRKRRANATPIA